MLVVDHAVPVSKGGTNDPANLVASCQECNSGKDTLIVAGDLNVGFLPWLIAQAERDDLVGDLARDTIRAPILRAPDSFKDLAAQIRRAVGARAHHVVPAAWHAWREYARRSGRPTRLVARMQEQTAPLEIVAAARTADAQLLHIADVQLLQWSNDERLPVWIRLYEWATAVGAAKVPAGRMHAHTYCGDALQERLFVAERARLRARKPRRGAKKFRGKTLERALVWSALNSGPLGSWHGRELLGDALFISEESDP